MEKSRGNKGFSLVELIIVVAIMATLLGVVATQYTKYTIRSQKAGDIKVAAEMARSIEAAIASNMAKKQNPHQGLNISLESGGGAYQWGWVANANSAVQLEDMVPKYKPNNEQYYYRFWIDADTYKVLISIVPSGWSHTAAYNPNDPADPNRPYVVYPELAADSLWQP